MDCGTFLTPMSHDRKAGEVAAPVMALDLGEKRVGVAVSDALRISVRRLSPLKRSNWKRLLSEVSTLTRRFDAQTLVIGLPLSLDGTAGDSAAEATRIARNFARSLQIPVFLQDERLTSVEAKENLEKEGFDDREVVALLDSEAAAIILRDFLGSGQARLHVSASEEN
jgi:putative Holliday junction resolvase